MPIYEYYCSSCEALFDLKQGFDADTIQSCPTCKEPATRKFHAPAIIYKGSGFYTTDYARKNDPSQSSNNEKAVDKPPKENAEKPD